MPLIHPPARLALTLGAGLLLISCAKPPAASAPTVPVNVTTVRRTDVPLVIRATGTVEPIQDAAVQAQVSGQLVKVRFREGDDVRAGQVLFEIDPRPFQAALTQAGGPLSRDHAQLENAKRDLVRNEELAAKQFVTMQQLEQSRATVNSLTGLLKSDSAAVEQARLNLAYATIRAPISGRAGSVLVKEGNQVRGGAGQTLVVINQISPILVRFPVASAYFDAVRRRATQSLPVIASPIGDSAHAQTGVLVFFDNAVDSLTGTVALKARFANPDRTLWPGALVAVSLHLDLEKDALVVPSSAVQTGQSGSAVWIVDSAKKAHVVKVTVLRSTDSLAVLAGGVEVGQQVVIDGQIRLTDGVTVSLRGARSDTSSGTAPVPGSGAAPVPRKGSTSP